MVLVKSLVLSGMVLKLYKITIDKVHGTDKIVTSKGEDGMPHTVKLGTTKYPVVKAKELPKLRLGRVLDNDGLFVFKSDDGILIRVWTGLQDSHVNVEPLDQTHGANTAWDVEILPEGTKLELSF